MKNFALAALLATVASTASFAGEHKEMTMESKKVETTHDTSTDPMTAKTTVETTKTTETK